MCDNPDRQRLNRETMTSSARADRVAARPPIRRGHEWGWVVVPDRFVPDNGPYTE